MSATDTTKTVGSKRGEQLLINIDICHVDTAVHRHGEVVPLTVAPVAWNLNSKAVGAVHQLLSLEGNVEDVLSTYLSLRTGTVADQYAATVTVGLEPEHHGIVLLLCAVHSVRRQLKSFVSQVQRVATRYSPVGTHQLGVGTLRLVHDVVARALIHRVVVNQSGLIACQTAIAVGRSDESTVHGTIPQASLHHAALVVLTV